jgi:hypothetical protein
MTSIRATNGGWAVIVDDAIECEYERTPNGLGQAIRTAARIAAV